MKSGDVKRAMNIVRKLEDNRKEVEYFTDKSKGVTIQIVFKFSGGSSREVPNVSGEFLETVKRVCVAGYEAENVKLVRELAEM